ncbi:MAG: thioredoxin [bacterium]|nr:thioredoxin [bacterium]
MVKKISQQEFQEAKDSSLAIIDFSASWCGPCKMLAPVLEQIADELEGKAKFYNVDVDENPDLAMEYGIRNIPALIILKDGEKIDSQVGFLPKEQLSKWMEPHL